jgi:putative transcriptional regulator
LSSARLVQGRGPGSSANELAAGKFLVASRTLLDPNFVEAVILLVDYSDEGAMGLVLNRPTEMKLATLLPEIDAVANRPDTVWLGGPVAIWQMVLLSRLEQRIEGSQPVLEDIHFSASRVVLEELVERGAEFRVYAGYAGWAPGQLDHELARGGWHLLPGDAAMVFDLAPSELWPELIRRSTVQWTLRSPGESSTTEPSSWSLQSGSEPPWQHEVTFTGSSLAASLRGAGSRARADAERVDG